MKTIKSITNPFFTIFLLITFLAGWYFYVTNPTTPYMEYMSTMETMETMKTIETMETPPTQQHGTHTQTETPTENTYYDIKNELKNIKDIVNVKDSSRDNHYNTNMYPGFDPTSNNIGMYTNLDKIHDSTSFSEISDNPMDINWGGILYTKQAVESGKYAENEVLPYGYDPKRGVGISTSIHNGNPKNMSG